MKKLFGFLFISLFFITGCLGFGTPVIDKTAGVFRSVDNGDTWTQKNLLLHSQGTASIGAVNVKDLVFDPADPRAIYLNSSNFGLMYSYDSTNSWMKATGIKDGLIESVSIDAKNKCIIYVSFANTILKSTDCSRSWAEVYIDTRAASSITALAVDHFNSGSVYAGNSGGDLLKSVDGGSNWRVIERLDNKIKKLLIDPSDSRVVYAATENKGIFKSVTAGETWVDISDGLKPFSGAKEFKDLVFDFNASNALLLVSKYGLIKTVDGGATWQAINLITPPTTTDIYSVAISPFTSNDIYYATASTFYRTSDGGQNWITKRLPTGAAATHLVVDPLNSGVLYIGLANIEKK